VLLHILDNMPYITPQHNSKIQRLAKDLRVLLAVLLTTIG